MRVSRIRRLILMGPREEEEEELNEWSSNRVETILDFLVPHENSALWQMTNRNADKRPTMRHSIFHGFYT